MTTEGFQDVKSVRSIMYYFFKGCINYYTAVPKMPKILLLFFFFERTDINMYV